MKLGTLLLRNAAIGLSQLEAALRNQVLYGGRLGTNLVELGYIDLELLANYLGEMSGFPVATPALLDEADRAWVERLSAEEAHRFRAIPLGVVESDGKIGVAFAEPTETATVMQVADKLGAMITPYIVPELRAMYYLEKLYGLPRRARFIRTARASAAEPIPAPEAEVAPDERRKAQPAGGLVMPPTFTLQPRARRSSQMPLSTTIPPATSHKAAGERIDSATHRDHIAEAFVDYAKGRCDSLVVFLIRDGNALGWKAWTAPPAALKHPIEELSLPLGGASSLQSAHDSHRTFAGEPPSTARPVESQLWSVLGAMPEPSTVAVIPVLVKQRVVNLVYAHSLLGPIPQNVIQELTDLAQRAAASYLRLIRHLRGS